MRLSPALLLLLPLARAGEPDTSPPCGQGCAGLEVSVVEVTIPLQGFALDQVIAEYAAATRDLRPARPALSDFEVCYKCGSTEVAESVSLRYALTVPLPQWTPPASVSDQDRTAILRFVAALQGRANRLVSQHREALARVEDRNRPPESIREDVERACKEALAANTALEMEQGCYEVSSETTFEVKGAKECARGWKPLAESVCRVR